MCLLDASICRSFCSSKSCLLCRLLSLLLDAIDLLFLLTLVFGFVLEFEVMPLGRVFLLVLTSFSLLGHQCILSKVRMAHNVATIIFE